MRRLVHLRSPLLRASLRSDEQGAVAVIIGVSLVFLLGFAALVIDLGAVFEERRDLQNGADAAALALALECASGGTCTPAALQAQAEAIASENTNDGQTTVASSDITIGTNEVTVVTHTKDAADGDDEVDYVLAPVLGTDGKSVSATASAGWGAPTGAGSIPITISACEWGNATGGLSNPSFPTAELILQFHASSNAIPACASGPGHDVDDEGDDNEGGFGFLESNNCEAEIIFVGPDLWIPTQTGASHPGSLGCPDMQSLLDAPILIPIFDDIETCSTALPGYTGQGADCYHVLGFGAFQITEMHFGGQWNTTPKPDCDPSTPGNSGDCIVGYFTELVLPGDIGEWNGSTPDLGVVAVKMTN